MKWKLALVAALIPACCVHAEDGEAVKHKLVGTWKLLSYIREEIPSGAKSDVMGPHPSGYLIYGNDGRMMVVFVRSDRRKPAGAVPTESESEYLQKGMVSYTGTYEVHSDTIVHHVDVSWNESWTGTDQTRTCKLESGDNSLARSDRRQDERPDADLATSEVITDSRISSNQPVSKVDPASLDDRSHRTKWQYAAGMIGHDDLFAP